jgi:hypothetical protein
MEGHILIISKALYGLRTLLWTPLAWLLFWLFLWDGIHTIEGQAQHLDVAQWWLIWVYHGLCWWPCDSI